MATPDVSEAELDGLLGDSCPDLGRTLNMIQTVREDDALRVSLKRACWVVDMHRAHHDDLRVGTPRDRAFYACVGAYVDDFLNGIRSHTSMLRVHDALVGGVDPARLMLSSRIAHSHALMHFDTPFMRRLVAYALSEPGEDDEDHEHEAEEKRDSVVGRARDVGADHIHGASHVAEPVLELGEPALMCVDGGLDRGLGGAQLGDGGL